MQSCPRRRPGLAESSSGAPAVPEAPLGPGGEAGGSWGQVCVQPKLARHQSGLVVSEGSSISNCFRHFLSLPPSGPLIRLMKVSVLSCLLRPSPTFCGSQPYPGPALPFFPTPSPPRGSSEGPAQPCLWVLTQGCPAPGELLPTNLLAAPAGWGLFGFLESGPVALSCLPFSPRCSSALLMLS